MDWHDDMFSHFPNIVYTQAIMFFHQLFTKRANLKNKIYF